MLTADIATYEVAPTAEQTGSVVWMHGLGASNHDFDDVVPLLDAPGVRFIFPAAPTRAVTINGGMRMPAWYDILAFEDPPRREDAEGARDSERLLRGVLERELARGVPSTKIALVGFSQGGAMALHVGTRFEQALAGVGVLSGYLILPAHFAAERHAANQQTPILFCHGINDPTVPLQLGRRAYDTVNAAGYPAAWHTFPMGHSMCMPEVDVLRDWLGTCGLRG